MAKQLNVDMRFTADTSQAKQQIQDLQRSLQEIAMPKALNINDQSIIEAKQAAQDLQMHLRAATDVNTGKLDLSKFSQSLSRSGQSLKSLSADLMKIGPSGEKAFMQLAQSINNANSSSLTLSGRMGQLVTTLKNVARFQISSSIIHGITGAISGALSYAQDLNKSLNNIRIVTGASTDEMARFAEQANKGAKALSATTLDYTNAALIYYQQGLSNEEVVARTETTLKLANVSRQSAEEVSSQMTAIWNNFAEGSENLEYYADVITKLGATTAASSEEIANGVSKFAAIAQTVGLSYEYAASALATIVAETRQSEDTVGNGLRTLFARFEGLKLGETLEDGVDLNKYSKALKAIGVDVLDANGNLREMDDILDDMGPKWDTLTKAQQVALAQTVGGVRQYTNLIALMDNWDKFQTNVETARGSEGTVDKQAKIYAESWEAARDRVKASVEAVYNQLLDDDAFIGALNFIEKVVDGISNIIKGMGGLGGVLSMVASIFMTHYAREMPRVLGNLKDSIMIVTGAAEKQRQKVLQENADIVNQKSSFSTASNSTNNADNARLIALKQTTQMQADLARVQKQLSTSELQANQAKIEEIKLRGENVAAIGAELDALNKEAKALESQIKMKMLANSSQPGYGTVTSDAKNVIVQAKAAEMHEAENDKKAADAEVARLTQPNSGASDNEIAQAKEKAAEAQKKLNAALQEYNKLQGAGINGKANISNLQALKTLEEMSKKYGLLNKAVEEIAQTSKSWNPDEMVQDPKKLEAVKKSMQEYVNILKQAGAPEVAGQLEKAINGMGSDPAKIESTVQAFRNIQETVGTMDMSTMITQMETLKQSIVSAGGDTTQIDALIQKWAAAGRAAGNYGAALGQLNGKGTEIQAPKPTVSEGLSTIAGAAMSVVSGFNAIKNLGNIWSDDSLSTGEKIIQSLSAMAMLLPTINSLLLSERTAQMGANIAHAIGIPIKYKAGEAGWAALGPALVFVAIAAVIVAAVAAIVVGLKMLIDNHNKDAIAAKNAAKAAEEMRDRSQEVADKAQEIKDIFSKYDEAVEALNECTKGTEEWSNALQAVNDIILDILANHPELASQLQYHRDQETGQLVIDNAQEVIDQADAQARAAKNASIMANYSAANAQLIADRTSARRQFIESEGYYDGEGVYHEDAAAVARNNVRREVIANAEKYQGLSKPEFQTEMLNKGLKLSGQALDEFYTSVTKLATETDNVANQLEISANMIAVAELGDEYSAAEREYASELYEKNYQDIYDKVIAESHDYSQSQRQGGAHGTKDLLNDEDSLWNRYLRAIGKNNTNYHLASNAIQGDDNNRTYHFTTGTSTEDQSLTEAQMAATIAAYEATQHLGESAENAAAALGKVDDNIKTTIGRTDGTYSSADFNNFIATGNMESSSQAAIEAIQQDIQDKYNGNYQKYLKDIYGEDFYEAMGGDKWAEQFEQSLQIDFENIGKNLPNKVQAIFKNMDLSKMTAGGQEKVATEMGKVYNKLGIEGAQAFSDVLNKAMEDGIDPEKVMNAWERIDWSAPDAMGQLTEILKEQGIEIDLIDPAWQLLITRMQEAERTAASLLGRFDALRTSMKEIGKITNDIEFGSVISDEDYQKLLKYNAAIAGLFTMTADGWQFVGDTKELDSLLNGVTDDLDGIKQSFEEANNAGEHLSNLNIDWTSGKWASGEHEREKISDETKMQAINNLAQKDYFGTILKEAEINQDVFDDAMNAYNEAAQQEGFDYNKWAEENAAYAQTLTGVWNTAGSLQQAYADDIYNSLRAEELYVNSCVESIAELNGLIVDGSISAETYEKTLESIARKETESLGLDWDTVSTQAELMTLAAVNGELEGYNDLLDENGQISAQNQAAMYELAIRNAQVDRGLQSLSSNMSKWMNVLKNGEKTSTEFAETVDEISEAVADLIGFKDKDLIPASFYTAPENLELIEKAATGSKEAIQALGIAVTKAHFESLKIDSGAAEKFKEDNTEEWEGDLYWNKTFDSEGMYDALKNFETYKQQFLNGLDVLQNAADGTDLATAFEGSGQSADEWIAALNKMALATNMSVEEMQSYLNSMGVKADITTTEQKLTTKVPIYKTEETAEEGGTMTIGNNEVDTIVKYSRTSIVGYEPVEQTVEVAQINTGDDAGTAPTVHRAGGAGSSRTGGGGRGGGGGGKSNKKEAKNPTKEKDRYHVIREKISDAGNAYNELSKAQDRAFGKQRLSAMEGITNNLRTQIMLQEKYLEEIRQYLEGDKKAVEELGAVFDENGVISNYDDLLNQLVNDYNAGIEAFNNGEIDEDTFKKNYEEPFNDAKEAIDQYVETINLLQSEELNLIDLQNNLADQFREIAAYKLELHIDIDEDELKYLDFLLEMLGENAEDAVDRLDLLGQQFNTNRDEIAAYTTTIQDLLRLRGFTDEDVAAFIRGELTAGDLEERGFTTDDIDKLREYRDAIQDNTTAMNDLAKEIEESFLNTLDDLNEKVDDAEERFEHFATMLEHFHNVVDIVGQDALGMSAETMKLLAKAAKENAIEMVKAAKTQLDSLNTVRAQAQAQLDAALEAQKNASTAEEKLRAEEAVRYWSDTISEVTNRVEQAEEDLADALENALEGIQEMYTTMIEQATKEFERSVTGAAGSLEQLQNNFDRQKETQELYIPTYEKIYELTKLMRDINNSIDDTDNLWSKQELAKLQDEINQKMEDGVELTEHDVEELRKRYELKLAEAALEEAQDAKRTIRMSRDNEGNWSYVYTADENDVAAAEQSYEDKLYEYQQMNYEYIQELQGNIIQAEQDMTDQINDLDVTKFASKEAYLAEVQRIMDATQAKEQQYKDQLAQTLDQQGILYEEDWKRYNELTGYRMARDDQWVDNWNETILAQQTGFETLEEMFDQLTGAIGGPDKPGTYVGDITDAYTEMQASNERALNAAGTSMQTYEQDTVDAISGIDQQMEETQNQVDEFTNSMTEAMEGVSDFIGEWKNQYGEAVKSITEFNKDLYDSCNTLIKKLQDTYSVNADFEAAQAQAAAEALAGSNRGSSSEGSPSGGSSSNNDTPSIKNPYTQSGGGNGSGDGENENEVDGQLYRRGRGAPKDTYESLGKQNHKHIREWKMGVYDAQGNFIKEETRQSEVIEQHTKATKQINHRVIEYCKDCQEQLRIYLTPDSDFNLKSGGYTGTWSAVSARTGMYTGSWNGPDLEENGRLAFLHQKELVLNASDTENFLSAVDMVRQISQTIDLQAASRSNGWNFLLPGVLSKEPNTLDQNVHIEAHFPNVTSHSEIEEAFTNLVGKASQFANR